MKFGIISDIHGNYEGLVSAIEHLNSLNCKVLCLGDIVSENSDENEKCIQILKNLNIQTVQGQHDDTCIKCDFPHVSIESRNFLASLPSMLEYHNILLVHDNPLENARIGKGMWRKGSYIRSEMAADTVFEDFKPFQNDIKYVFVGHTHAPKIFSNKCKIKVVFDQLIQLKTDGKYIINPGSIGGTPRGEEPVHSYVLFDTDLNQVIYYRLKQKDLTFTKKLSLTQQMKSEKTFKKFQFQTCTGFNDFDTTYQINSRNNCDILSEHISGGKNIWIYHITKNLSVCGYAGITSKQEISDSGFQAQLQCTTGFDDWLNEITDVKCLPFDDGVSIPFGTLNSALKWLGDHWDKGHRILVSCASGESRSVCIAICLLTLKAGMTFFDACRICFTNVPTAYPHPITLISAAKYCDCRLNLNQLRQIFNLVPMPPPFPWSDNELIKAITLYGE